MSCEPVFPRFPAHAEGTYDAYLLLVSTPAEVVDGCCPTGSSARPSRWWAPGSTR